MLIAGLIKQTKGDIIFEGKSINYPFKKNIRHQIQILFQHPDVAFNPKLKIIDSLKEAYQLYKKGYHESDIVDDIHELGLKEEYLYRYPSELSGGEQQRLALVRALTVKPKLLILDEPTSMLDMISQAMIMDILKKYQEKNQTSYLFITHNQALADIFSNRFYHIEKGEIVNKNDIELA